MKTIAQISIALAVGLTSASLTFANDAHHHATDARSSESVAAMSEGVVRKVDKENGEITIRHGELKNLGMQPMTMVFRIKDVAMLDLAKVGDKISFVAENSGGQLTVTQLEIQK
ncbi:copper-binding protein [Herminiimonas sp. NPDC097707]|uniref:copper-binding protein n=1 Tax=Herminiimonas sp. NPDC097707 TaxID=3364007 RepID=UPI003839DC5C